MVYPDGQKAFYQYNSAGQVIAVLNQDPSIAFPLPVYYAKDITYNEFGQVTHIAYGNGVVTDHTYDPLTQRLQNVQTLDASSKLIQDLSYTYDAIGNILTITDTVNTAGQTFQYDALNRLTRAVAPATYGTKTFVYDAIGNIIEKDGLTYTYGAGNAGPHAVTSLSDGTVFTYDLNGNMASKKKSGITTKYFYDIENRLKRVTRSGVTQVRYTYDGDGGRTKKSVLGAHASEVQYVGQLYEKTDGVPTDAIFLGSTRIATITNGSDVRYYHADHLGSLNIVTDNTGSMVELIEYQPYGSFSRHDFFGGAQAVAHSYFTSQYNDDETGLYYYGARYYDPQLGRFITADTVVQNPFDSQTLNRYSYTGNNPVNRIDPTGHSWFGDLWDAIKKPFIAAVTAAIVVFTWGAAAPVLTGMGALFSHAGAVTVASAAASTAVLETKPGQKFIRFLSKSVFDNVFGMSPRVASFFGNITAYMATNTAFQSGFAKLTTSKTITDVKDFDPSSQVDQDIASEILQEGNGINYGTRPTIKPTTGELRNVDRILYNGNEAVGLAAEALEIGGKMQHLGVVMKDLGMQSDMAGFLAGPKGAMQSLSQGYLSFGISHTAVNISLLNSGYSTTINNLLSGGWTTIPSTFVYGPYGGGGFGAIAYEKNQN